MKKRVKKDSDGGIGRKLKHEKLVIIIMIAFIVVLAGVLGYDIYTKVKAKVEAEAKITALNEDLASLITSRDNCLSERDNLTIERDTLNTSVTALANQRTQLNNQNDQLSADLDACQSDLDASEAELATAKEDLSDCQAASV
jgi:chromosome segregation ATPase